MLQLSDITEFAQRDFASRSLRRARRKKVALKETKRMKKDSLRVCEADDVCYLYRRSMVYRRKGQEKEHTLNTRARITMGKYLDEQISGKVARVRARLTKD